MDLKNSTAHYYEKFAKDFASNTLNAELSAYVECNAEKPLAVSDRAYQIASNSSSNLWEEKGGFRPA